MAGFHADQDVLIPCVVEGGGLPGEAFVTVESAQGPISGFVRTEFVLSKGEHNLIRARVLSISPDIVVVQMPGSFFTTASGRTAVRLEWADANLQPVGA